MRSPSWLRARACANPDAMRFGILISGRGSNMAALLDAHAVGLLPSAEFAVVLSNNPGAPGLELAGKRGVPAETIDHRLFKGDRAGHEAALLERLHAYGVEAVVLAGYMRVLAGPLLRAFPQRVINIHPALLPAFPGTHSQRQAIEYGVRVSGCTAHFVDEGVDTGPIILQRVVTVREDDTEESLSARILVEEHRALVDAVGLLAEKRLRVSGRLVSILPPGERAPG